MQLQMLAQASPAQLNAIAAAALMFNDVQTAQHLVKHYAMYFNNATYAALQQLAQH